MKKPLINIVSAIAIFIYSANTFSQVIETPTCEIVQTVDCPEPIIVCANVEELGVLGAYVDWVEPEFQLS